jgi:alpha-aminoadipate/glutamate carrier protein LysW
MDTKCIECDANVSVPDDAIAGEIVSCRDCGSEYEVAQVSNGTAMLKPAEEVEEDWGE